ncbi:phosphopantothenoylcysteine decarboxylase, partial [Georgenia sp. 10Sc9-8]|nr:phosphopantothenoylcysteine decarboxylase [Georgenia halotolerans]
DVVLVAANVDPGVVSGLPPGVRVQPVESTAELRAAVRAAAAGADATVMAAAVADFRPLRTAGHKIKKRGDDGPAPIELTTNPDVLAELAAHRLHPGQVVVGFAAETGDDGGDALAHGRAKARRKGADLLAVNEVGLDRGFGDVPNAVTVLDADGEVVGRAAGTKAEVAAALWDVIAERLPPATTIDR